MYAPSPARRRPSILGWWGLQHAGEPGAHARRGRRQHRALPGRRPGQHRLRSPAIICHWQLCVIPV